MNQKLYSWVEDYLFFPNTSQKIISILLLPLTLIYVIIVALKRGNAKAMDFGLPVISIGNLVVGGSGKTPFAIFLAQNREDVCIILRGYGRDSKGLYVISKKGNILEDVSISGDEAMLLAQSLPKASVIVSENRVDAIHKAKELGAQLIILDDGFSKANIKKFDILLRPKKEPENLFCLPSGGYREPKMLYTIANMVLKEGVDFQRYVSYKHNGATVSILPHKLLLLTAISKPKRLLEFLPQNTLLESFPDHHDFTAEDIDNIQNNYEDYAIITTSKDLVKLKKFNIKDIYLMDLELHLNGKVDLSPIDNYINSYIRSHSRNFA